MAYIWTTPKITKLLKCTWFGVKKVSNSKHFSESWIFDFCTDFGWVSFTFMHLFKLRLTSEVGRYYSSFWQCSFSGKLESFVQNTSLKFYFHPFTSFIHFVECGLSQKRKLILAENSWMLINTADLCIHAISIVWLVYQEDCNSSFHDAKTTCQWRNEMRW